MNAELTIADLLREETKREYIDRIPTNSRHEQLAREILNAILNENEEWFPAVSALAVYPIQKWSAETRTLYRIDTQSLERLIKEEGIYFGMNASRYLQNHIVAMRETDCEIQLITSILKSRKRLQSEKNKLNTLNAIHGINKSDLSKYMIERYYKDAVTDVCRKYNKEFLRINRNIIKTINFRNDEMKEAYHNTDWLIRHAWQFRNHVKSHDIDYEAVCRSLLTYIRCLETYSINGKELYEVIILSYKGMTESQTAAKLRKSRTYVRSRYKTGIEILSYLIWGYSSREILQRQLSL